MNLRKPLTLGGTIVNEFGRHDRRGGRPKTPARGPYRMCPVHGVDCRYEPETDLLHCQDCHSERRRWPTFAEVWNKFTTNTEGGQ
jgi:hypothetical protein